MSQEAWDVIKNAKEDLIVTINNSAAVLPDDAGESDLSRKIFENTMDNEVDAIGNAQRYLKDEIQQYF